MVANGDIQDFPAQFEKLLAVCRDWGCFRIVNHKIPPALMSEMKLVSRSLLDLPVEIKERNAHPVVGKGCTPPNQGSSAFEGLGCFDMASPGNLEAFFDQLDASPHQRDTIVKYSQVVHMLALDMGCKILGGMGLEGDLFKGWPCQFRMNKYNYTPDRLETREYVPVDPMSGSLVVNLGDLAMIWSNGRFCSAKHRVQCYEGTVRVSIACFVLGPKDRAMEAAPELVDTEHPRLYIPMNFEDYRILQNTTKSPTGAIEFLRVRNF